MAELEVPETMHFEDSHEEPQEQTERQPSAREITMQAIAERAEARRQEEIALGQIYDQDARDAGLTFPDEDAEEEPRPAPRRVEEQPQPARQPDGLRTVNFDGRSFQVTGEQYDALAQMGMLANAAISQYQQPQYQQPQPQYQPPPQQQPQQRVLLADPELVRETVRRIQYGGEEDGAEALSRLVAEVASRVPQAPQVDTNAIVHQAAAVAQQQQRFAAETAVIQQEYKDVFADPQRTHLAKLNVDAIRQRNVALGRSMTDLQVYREAGDMVLDALKMPRPNRETDRPALQAAPSRQDVIERKRAAPRTTTQVDRRAPSPTPSRGPTSSEIVDRMRQQRGQPSMM